MRYEDKENIMPQDMDMNESGVTHTQDDQRRLRSEYRNLIHSTKESHQDLIQGNVRNLIRSVQNADSLFRRVKETNEAALDSKFILEAAHIASQKARAMKVDSGLFDMDEFMGKLTAFMAPPDAAARQEEEDEQGQQEEDGAGLQWKKLRRITAACTKAAILPGFMLGPLSLEQKVRTITRRQTKLVKDVTKLKKPVELSEKDIEAQENETSISVQRVFQVLQKHEPLNFFRFFINPESFGQSVENLFHISFLVKDGRVGLLHEEGELLIQTIDPEDMDGEVTAIAIQNMFDFDQAMWKELIDTLKITQPVIPTREVKKETHASNKWYG